MPSHNEQIPNLRKIEGQVRGLIKMIEDGRYCMDILTQFKSVKSALTTIEKKIFQRHIETCFLNAFKDGDESERQKKIDEVMNAISSMK